MLNHLNENTSNPTNPYDETSGFGTDISSLDGSAPIGGLPKTIDIAGLKASAVNRVGKVRYGNASSVRMEIRCGKDEGYELRNISVDYLKTPQQLELTQDQLDSVEDTSQILEWPDYMCYEIINELAPLILENSGDPRLQTNTVINQTIAPPVQQQSTKK